MRLIALVVLAVAGCAGNLTIDPYAPARGGEIAAGPASVPDIRCAGAPKTAPARGFRSWRDAVLTRFAHTAHRGFDLVTASDEPQVVRGRLAYGIADKRLAREDVEVFACIAGAWQPIGATRTDGRGGFALALAGADRLPVGLRDVYASVVADRSGVRFLAYVAPRGSRVVVSDIDGTLTSSESSFVKAVFLGSRVRPHPGAAAALRAAAARGYQVVYLTARGDRFTDATRHWLGTHGFPRGPVRLAPWLIVKPGARTIAYKQRVLRGLAAFELAAAVGNRHSDVAAYRAAGVPAARIFVKLPEYSGELAPALSSGAAVGFGVYGPLALP